MSEQTIWKSHAKWPDGTIAGCADQISVDTHISKENAEGVCKLLRKHGFGGEGKIFPLLVWVSQEPPAKPQTIDEYLGNPPGTFAQMVKDNPDPDGAVMEAKWVARSDVDEMIERLSVMAKIGERWLTDSSLEKWFPFTAEELAKLRAELANERMVSERFQKQITDALDEWKAFYDAALEEAHKNEQSAASENDTHGMNFHQGKRSGLISCDIGLGKLKEVNQPKQSGPV